MNTATDRSLFRQTVAQVAEKARAVLPTQVNGRIESAARLVLLHDVTPQPDGSILVGSSTDALKVYRLQGTSCTCQDFAHGKAPAGWCSHRIAAGIAKRVQELLATTSIVPAEATAAAHSTPLQPVAPLPEAAASVNVRVTIAGREVQWTLRDSDEARLAVRLEALLARYPVPQPAPKAPPASQEPGWRAVHQVQLTWNEGKDGRKGWFSHRTDQGWCKGRK